jgi:MFS family permease
VTTLGWLLPSLFVAGHTQTLARKLPFVLRYTVWERAPFLVLAAVAIFVAAPAPRAALAVTLAMLLVITTTGGLLMPAWMDIVGRAVPVAMRGRFFATANLLGAAGGFAGSFLTAHVLGVFAGPRGYGVCFLLAAGFMGLSWMALAFTREPPAEATSTPVAVATYLRRVPGLLRRDNNLSWFLVARALTLVGTMATGFYTVYALRRLGAPPPEVGVFTMVLFAGQIVGNVAFGWMGDRMGHRIVLMAGVIATIGASVLALTVTSVQTFSLVFALTGLQIASVSVSSLSVLLEFAPSVEERPTYIGVGNTFAAPFAFLSPLLAGLLADASGFAGVFAVAGLASLLALAVLALQVREPRHAVLDARA